MSWQRLCCSAPGAWLLALGLACSTPPERVAGPPVPPPGVIDTGQPVWRDTSALIAISAYNIWDGTSSYEAGRELLTSEQLGLIESLRVLAAPVRAQPEDVSSYELQVTDEDGSVARYPADAPEGLAGAAPDTDYSLTVDFGVVWPLLDGCLTVYETLTGSRPEQDAGANAAPGVSEGVELPPAARHISTATPGCLHGILGPTRRCEDIALWLDVEQPGSYRVSTTGCSSPLELRVYSPSGDAELARASGTTGGCPSLVHTFDAAGSHPVLVSASGGDACLGTTDVLLRVAPVEPSAGAP